MLRHQGRTIFSASDLVNFMGCRHATALDLRNLVHPATFPPDDETAVLLQEKGIEHERAYLDGLRTKGLRVVEVPSTGSLEERSDATIAAMRAGADVVYQGAFLSGRWHGYSDFLLRREGVRSAFGTYAYDVADTKLARSAKPKHVMQLCVYAHMLAQVQGVAPPAMHVVLGSGEVATLPTSSVIHYFDFARQRFEAFVDAPHRTTEADPCGHCGFCRWSERCGGDWEAADHLSIVAGMGRSQRAALRAAGVADVGALAALPADARIVGMQAGTTARLAAQARLQAHQRSTGERRIELLAPSPGRGFERLPRPDVGDVFFDMEGDPLFPDGLEYLFGIVAFDEDGVDRFHEFWAHDRAGEKAAFERTVDFMTDRLSRHPDAHVYHYASYEQTALKKLAMYHGTREEAVDDLLRGDRLVDLYKVVAEGVRTSEPRYSIKNMEAFYLPGGRGGEVKTAGDSIVIYERWRRLGDDRLLREIADYNEVDCRSTRMCRDWLIGLRPPETPWFEGRRLAPADPAKTEEREAADRRTRLLADAIIAGQDAPWRRLLIDLLEFHRREAKPTWWAMFARQEMDADALLEDAECLAGLEPHPLLPSRQDKRSTIRPFSFPAQDFKMKVGDKPLRSGTLEPVGEIRSIDEDERVVEIRQGPSHLAIAPGTALIPAGPVGDKVLRAAVHRYAEGLLAPMPRYPAVTDILRRDPPNVTGRAGKPILIEGDGVTAGTITALRLLHESYLLIQGPPGAGKTYTSSQAIVALLASGKRIGVASNSHKAINNLLREVEAIASAHGFRFRGMKKSTRSDQALGTNSWIEDVVGGSGSGVAGHHQLIAGTAWLFAREELDQALDYLFIDEAGQVSLANVVAMGTSARNVVLVGDQMQLSQPIKGTHPGGSGRSALEHLLEGHATVPPDRGVFLPVTRRMHPDLCRFVSEAVYDGRLEADPAAARQRLEIDRGADPEALGPAGLRFVEVHHAGRTQRSPEEADRLARTYRALLGSRWTDHRGVERVVGVEDVLVVSPYNMQVELLKRTLPDGARIGTVDKFQGQEAPVVLVSMATSSGDDLPRNIEFLYSRNRLNVAISRAKCLAVIYASPRLLETPCSSIEQMELINGLCWAKRFADDQRSEAATSGA